MDAAGVAVLVLAAPMALAATEEMVLALVLRQTLQAVAVAVMGEELRVVMPLLLREAPGAIAQPVWAEVPAEPMAR
jgi:hypothetical protein